MNIKNKQFKTFDPNPSLKYALQLLEDSSVRLGFCMHQKNGEKKVNFLLDI